MTAILRRRSNMKMPLFTSGASQEPEPVISDYSQEYLTLEVVTDGTIGLKTNGSIGSKTLSYKVNNGEWTSISTSASSGGVVYIQNLVAGDKVKFKGSNNSYATSKNNYMNFEGGTATFNIWGNIMSLTDGDNFTSATSLTGTFNFCSLFKLSPCLSAENLILPVLTLTEACYRAMFSKATLTVAPKELPATTLAQYVYWYMFEDCAITTAPDLPFTGTLPAYAYGYMFTGCSNLNSVKCLATNVSATSATTGWLTNVAQTGTFIKNPDMSGWSTGVNGIPSGWTTQDLVTDYSNEYFTIVSRANNNVISLKANIGYYGNSTIVEVEVSTDNGNTWTTKQSSEEGTTLATLNNGDKLLIRGQNVSFTYDLSSDESNTFIATGDFDVQGNIMSLLDYNDFNSNPDFWQMYTFRSLFQNNTHLIHAHNLVLPVMNLMGGDYREMFSGCTSLVSGPTLPALVVASSSYMYMFEGCSSLTSITCLATDISESWCVDDWVYGVGASGTFTKNSAMSSWETGDSGIPSGWTVQDYVAPS